MMEHYVYVGYLEGQLVYIGKGKGGRSDHLNSGTSHCYSANLCHFSGGVVDVVRVAIGLSDEDSLELEQHLIAEAMPVWNTIKPGMKGSQHALGTNYKKATATSKYFGVSYTGKGKNPWRAWHRVGRDKNHIGLYPTELSAAQARDKYLLDNGIEGVLNFEPKT